MSHDASKVGCAVDYASLIHPTNSRCQNRFVFWAMRPHSWLERPLTRRSSSSITVLRMHVPHEHPVVDPHVSHFMQVPFRTKVKFPHSPHISPS
jgi:hypothetical protein